MIKMYSWFVFCKFFSSTLWHFYDDLCGSAMVPIVHVRSRYVVWCRLQVMRNDKWLLHRRWCTEVKDSSSSGNELKERSFHSRRQMKQTHLTMPLLCFTSLQLYSLYHAYVCVNTLHTYTGRFVLCLGASLVFRSSASPAENSSSLVSAHGISADEMSQTYKQGESTLQGLVLNIFGSVLMKWCMRNYCSPWHLRKAVTDFSEQNSARGYIQ